MRLPNLYSTYKIVKYIFVSHFPFVYSWLVKYIQFFLYNFIDNSRKYDWKEWDFSKTMSGKICLTFSLRILLVGEIYLTVFSSLS